MKTQQNESKEAFDLLNWICSRAGDLATIGIICLTGLIIADIVLRRIFNSPLTFSYEIISLGLLVIVFSSICYATEQGRHVSIDLLTAKFPQKFRIILQYIIDCICAIFFLILAWRSIKYGSIIKEMGTTSGTIGIPLYPFYYFMAICSALIGVTICFACIHQYRRNKVR